MAARPEGATRLDTCTLSMARRIAAMLDLDPAGIRTGDSLPRGWHFPLLAADTRRGALRADGFPGLGVPMPDLGLPRLLLAARSVEYRDDIPIGAAVKRVSAAGEVARKDDARGPRAVVTITHALTVDQADEPALIETQTYMLLRAGRYAAPDRPGTSPMETGGLKVVPDDTLLFQFSALGFNSHRIHLDRAWAREVEGFPDLVVNGGLTTLLLTEHARRDLGLTLCSLRLKYTAPLFAGRPLTLAVSGEGTTRRLRAYDDTGVVAVDAEGTVA